MHVLHGFVQQGPRRAAIADFRYVSQAKPAGGNAAISGDTYVVDGQNSALVFKRKYGGAVGGSLQPCAVVVGGVVKADRRVIAAKAHVQIIIGGISQLK